jgi:hypothetical protein
LASNLLVGDIAEWVWKRLNRPDKQDICVEAAANFYLLVTSAIPFEEMETTSAELTLDTTTPIVDLSSLSINLIYSIRLTNGSQTRRLRRSNVRVYDSQGFTTSTPGVPATYARWGTNIELEKIPQSAMTVRLRYYTLPVLESLPANTAIIIPTPWYELMRYETLFRVWIDLEEFDKANMLVAPMPLARQNSPHSSRVFEYGIIPKLWNDLLKTCKQRENGDEDFSINPVVRKYTA